MHRHWGLSIDRQAEQIRARDRLIRQLSILALALSAIVFILAIMLIAATRVYASEGCLSKAEARTKWPKAHLFWHTAEKCWDNHAGRGRHYGKRESKPDLTPRPAPPARADASGNSSAKKILWPTLKPTVEFSFQSFLVAEPMTLWPPILDVDEVTADPPDCCWPKLDKDFEVRWNEMPAVWLAKLKEP